MAGRSFSPRSMGENGNARLACIHWCLRYTKTGRLPHQAIVAQIGDTLTATKWRTAIGFSTVLHLASGREWPRKYCRRSREPGPRDCICGAALSIWGERGPCGARGTVSNLAGVELNGDRFAAPAKRITNKE